MKKKENQSRALTLGKVVNEEERTVEVSISSEEPVRRWDGDEILVHEDGVIDMSRFPLPLCVAHETYRGLNIGLIEDPVIENKKLRGTLRFGERTEANEYFTDVKNGIIRNISVGYRINESIPNEKEESYRVTDWMPFEASLVSVPADNTVGIGRSFDNQYETLTETIESASPEEQKEILTRVSNLVEKYTPENPIDSEDPPEPDPMIRPNLGRQIALKQKQVIVEEN